MKTLSIFLTFLLTIQTFAQDNRFGKVSKEELSKTRSTIDGEAPAEILYEKTEIKLDFMPSDRRLYVTQEVEGRIKVYDKNNTDKHFLQLEIPMRAPGSIREKIISFRMATYNLENGKIEETRIRNNEIFTERINRYWEVQKAAFPNVKDGSVIEYKYTVQSPFYRDIDRWFFQSSIPVISSELKFSYPEFLEYSIDSRGEVIGRTSRKTSPNPTLNYDTEVIEMSYQNIKPLRREPFVFNSNNLKSSVRFELLRLAFPGLITENYSTTWDQIGEELNKHDDHGRQLSGNNFLDAEVQSIVGDSKETAEIVQKIFNHVKDNYAWNEMNSIYTEKGIRLTHKEKSGNAADINLLLVAMLRKAGVNANPVLISTVNNMMINYSFPSATSFNFVIVAAEINKGLYLMDATEKLSKINMLPLRDLNHRGFLLLSNNTMREITLINNTLSSIKENISFEVNPEDGTISGNFMEIKDEYYAMVDNMARRKDPKSFEEDYLSKLKFDVSNFRIDENPNNGTLRYSFRFENVPSAEILGNKILINPMLFIQTTRSDFNYETRNYPLEFGTRSNNTKSVRIKIPEGYRVEVLPQEKQMLVDGNHAGFAYKINEKDGYLEITSIYQTDQSILPASFYKMMKDLERQKIEAESQQIVLVKI